MAIDIRSLNSNQLPLPTEDGTGQPNAANTPSAPTNSAHGASLRGVMATDSVVGGTSPHTIGAAGSGGTSAPTLPDPVGPKASPKAVSNLLASTTMYDQNMGTLISSAEAFNILQKSAMSGYMLSSAINRAANTTAIDAKKAEASNLFKQVLGEREHALNSFVTSIASAVATVGVPLLGSRMAKSPVDEKAVRSPDPTPGTPGTGGVGGSLSAAAPGSDAAKKAQDAKKATDTKGKGKDIDPTKSATGPAEPAADMGTRAAKAKAREEELKKAQLNGQAGPSNLGQGHPGTTPSAVNSGGSQSQAPIKTEKDAKTVGESNRIDLGNSFLQAGTGVGGVITAGGELYDKTAATGGQFQADQAKIAQKQDAIDAQVADVAKDSSKSSQEQALETLKAAQQLVQSFSQRWTEVNNNIANR